MEKSSFKAIVPNSVSRTVLMSLYNRVMYENEMRLKEEEYLYSLTQKDELYLNTVSEFEEKLSELRLKNSPAILESTETPRVSLKVDDNTLNLNNFKAGDVTIIKLSAPFNDLQNLPKLNQYFFLLVN